MVAFGYRSTRVRMGCGWTERNSRMARSVVVVRFMPGALEVPRPAQAPLWESRPARLPWDSDRDFWTWTGHGPEVSMEDRRRVSIDSCPQSRLLRPRLFAVPVCVRRVHGIG